MKILLIQLDGKLPNIALMRIAAHHRRLGDDIEFRSIGHPRQLEPGLFDHWDWVYASLIFKRTRPLAERLLQIYPQAMVGGSGWNLTTRIEDYGMISLEQDYSIYPQFSHSVGFTHRGCRLKCPFCVVPVKEGAVREEQSVYDIWRGEPHLRNILLLDNDFFGQSNWRNRIQEIREGDFKICFSQGINARMLTDEAAEAMASIKYRDDQFKTPRIYTAWGNLHDESRLFNSLRSLVRYGVKPDHIMV